MIVVKNKIAINKMKEAGKRLADLFTTLNTVLVAGMTSLDLDLYIEKELFDRELTSRAKGYMGYPRVSCISVNDVVVHGIPTQQQVFQVGDLVKVDICASWRGYCADMARCFFVGGKREARTEGLVKAAARALDVGISQTCVGNRVSDISAAIQNSIALEGYGIVRDFAGHGIGKSMHEPPEIPNFGRPGCGPIIREGMTFAIEPMITLGKEAIYVDKDGWTARTKDKSIAAHVEDTVLVTKDGPIVLTRLSGL